MPLVISQKSKRTHYVRSEEVLGEILGHSDFDGEDWAIRDVIVFEDRTVAEIEKHPDGPFQVWSAPKPGVLEVVLSQIRACADDPLPKGAQITSWETLFDRLSAPPPKTSWWRKMRK